MSKTTTTVTPDDALTEVRERLCEATTAHEQARAASEQARADLAELEAAADRGEAVKTAAYTEAKADLGLKSRRTAALAAQVAQAQQAVNEAQKAAHLDGVRRMVSAIPSLDKPHQKAVKAFEDYLDAVRAQDQAIRDLYVEAKDLPDYAHGRLGQEKATGWPASATLYQGQWNTESRIGHVQIDGKPIRRPDINREAERLAETVVRLARERRN
ncbi:hypothetical protein [Kocuria rosea]|uniref:hypothetical protein n=1 Tax=Kocuria rosea TaxID=1275 RepID=UPI00232EBBF7|nr:hypothetical protein [Kocuria rosea]